MRTALLEYGFEEMKFHFEYKIDTGTLKFYKVSKDVYFNDKLMTKNASFNQVKNILKALQV